MSEITDRLVSVDEIKTLAQRWYDREIERAVAAHRSRWPEHRTWIEAYLRSELRQRLKDRGWA